MQTTYEKVVSVCSYCGSGCQIEFTVDKKANRIISAKGAPGRTNEGRLCLKGFYGWDYLNDPQILTRRITSPMIRKGGKGSPLEPVSWDEAIAYAAERLKAIIKEYGPDSVMGAGSARLAVRGMKRGILRRSLCAPWLVRIMWTIVPAFVMLLR